MKKVSRKIFGLLAAAMILAGAGAFVSCKNNASDSSDDAPKAPLSETATVSEVDGIATSGTSASVTGSVATLSASNGTYILTPYQGTSGNISADVAPSTTNGGKWKFTETGNTIAKYIGSYTGSIETIGSSDTNLKLKVEKILNKEGLLTAVVEEKSIDMTVSSSGTFEATIPAVKINSVTSYIQTNITLLYESAENYSINSFLMRLDLSDGKHTMASIISQKSKDNDPTNNIQWFDFDDNTYRMVSGTYTIADGKFTTPSITNTIYTINDNGDLCARYDTFKLVSANCKLYANAVTKADGENSYAQIKAIYLKEDSGKTGQIINESKKRNKYDGDTKDITYTISGDTITFTGVGAAAGYSKTATLSDGGKKLTLDGDVYLKL